jgi:putative ABC transport system ATP-binding protein
VEIKLSYLIELENIEKNYQLANTTFQALKGVSLRLQCGEMVAIIGASGSGKSTLMNIIGFLDQPTRGQYFFAGENVSSLTSNGLAKVRNKKIGFIFQSFFLLPRFDARQNVMLPLFYRDEMPHAATQKATAILEKVGMAHVIHHKPNQLSGGQQQRVAIARALVGDPEIILADEPTGALDSQTGHEVMELLVNLNREEGRTIVIVTHDKEISQRCQRIVTLKDGYVVD